MGQVATQKRWEFEPRSYRSFPKVVSKKPQSIGIGFEWEVQLNWDNEDTMSELEHRFRWDTDAFADRYTQTFADRYNFYVHGECDASEFCSPVAYNLQTIKALGRKLQQRVAKDRLLAEDCPEEAGIHVHTSVKGATYGDMELMFKKVILMLNRESSANFVLSFSGRQEDSEWSQQGEATCWDSYTACTNGALGEAKENTMCKLNSFDVDTIEYRLWNGTPCRLLPALEFAHACTKFVSQHKGTDIPYLVDFKMWLFKQVGYKMLKTQPEWVWVN